LAMACDIRVASTQAKMGFREHRLGLIPSHGGTHRLVRLLGISKAKALYFSGDLADAEASLSLGLVARIVPPDRLVGETLAWASQLAERAPLALAEAKALLNSVPDRGREEATAAEDEAQERMVRTGDHKEGIRAFRSQREPRFKGE